MKLRKILAVALASAMVFTTVACGATETNETAGTSEVVSTETAGTETVPEDGESWRIGGIGPITGGAAIYGVAVQQGAQIAIDEINAAGGINGTPIEFSFEDDEHNPEKSVNAYNALKDWGMQLLLGTVTSGPCTAVAAEAAVDNMFLLTPSGSSTDILADKTNAFQVCFSDPNQGVGSAQYIGENAMATKVAVIYDSSDVYSTGIYEKFAAEAENQPFEIVVAEAFTADSNTDFSVQLQKAKSAGAELVFLPIYYQQSALILTQANDMDYAPTFFSCDGMDGILGADNFDTSLAEGVVLLTPFVADATDEATVNFVTKYQEAYGETPIQFAADAYDGMYIIKAALEKAGLSSDASVSEICEALKAAMVEITFDGLTGEGMTWQATGEVSKDPKAMVIKDGVYVTY